MNLLKFLQSHWTRKLFSFGLIHMMRLLLPLLAFPWLSRVLGPDYFGLLMFMCLVPPIISLLVEWGFPLAGARMAARARGYPWEQGQILANIILAKLLLAAVCVATAIILMPWVPYARQWPGAYFLAVAMGIARGLTPLWFFQGCAQNMRMLVCWDAGSGLLILILTIIFIRQPEDWILYLLFTAVCKLCAYIWLSAGMLWKYPHQWNIKQAVKTIYDSRTLFGGLMFTDLYQYGSQFVLGYFLPASEMGVIAAVSKMLRALTSLSLPLTQSVFPEICVLKNCSIVRARHILRVSLAGTVGLMLLAVLFIWILAPWIIHVALGGGYQAAIPVLKIMVLAAPFSAANYVLGQQILVPFDHEKIQAYGRGLMAVASLPLAALVAWRWGLSGSAFLPLAVEASVFIVFCLSFFYLCPRALLNVGKKH